VLFVSGTLDTNTPPFQAEEMRWGFPNSYHLIVENGSHESLLHNDVHTVMIDFLKGVDVQQRTVKFNPPDFMSVNELKAQALKR
jgi:pimeloyl-ACP methyl ester carboxylesterase